MSRTDEFWGANSVDRMFGDSPKTSVPWPEATPTKTHRYYDPRKVDEALSRGQQPEPVDPRGLHATQPEVTRAGVSHYMSGTGQLYADAHQPGNQNPVVFHDEMRNRDVLLSGHHRAATALLRGEQFGAVRVSGTPATHDEARAYQHEVASRQREERTRQANEAMMARIAASKNA